MAKPAIQARILKGFRDSLPETSIPKSEILSKITQVFETFGFVPIETPALEYAEVLLGKGSEETDKQMYRFEDNGKRDVALRFDLTVPLARYVAMHVNELGTPFRRYHIAPVWRAEKPQRGRYREFTQCDFDIIGTSSVIADAEIISLMNRIFRTLEIGHTIRFNNRMLLNSLLEQLNARENSVSVLRAIDKLEKLGEASVRAELAEQAHLSADQIDQILNFTRLSQHDKGNAETVSRLRSSLGPHPTAAIALQQIETILEILDASNIGDGDVSLDVSIARGLDYYTGSVFETNLDELPDIGSVCSGGRYDDLASLYTKQQLPGVGASVGLDRLIAALEELGTVGNKRSTAEALVTIFDENTAAYSASVANALRDAGLRVELYPQPAKLANQLKYADRKNINFVILLGEDEKRSSACTIKTMSSGEQDTALSLNQTISLLNARLGK